MGHWWKIFKEPSGEPQREWIDTVENDGVIYYRWLFNESRILVTSPKALAEVLVQRSYEFVKPERVRKGIGRLLGIGILVAEGDEHKVRTRSPLDGIKANLISAPKKSTPTRFCIPACQGSVSHVLG